MVLAEVNSVSMELWAEAEVTALSANIIPPTSPMEAPMAEIPSPISTVVPVGVLPLVLVGVQAGVQSLWKRMEMVPLRLLPVR